MARLGHPQLMPVERLPRHGLAGEGSMLPRWP